MNIKALNGIRFVNLAKAAVNGMLSGVRDASRPITVGLLGGLEPGVEFAPGRTTGTYLFNGERAGLGLKFHVFDDGSFSVDLSFGGDDLKSLAAALDTAAAALAEMDTHALREGWANETPPSVPALVLPSTHFPIH